MDNKFFDVRIFHHSCPSNSNQEITSCYKKHEGEKKRSYNACILNVEKATFTPLVFSTHGGMGKEAKAFHKRLASLISTKRDILYSDVMSYVRRRLRFCILRSCLAAIRGYRGKPSYYFFFIENFKIITIIIYTINEYNQGNNLRAAKTKICAASCTFKHMVPRNQL